MIQAERIWRIQRASGAAAMILLALALMILFDGLRGGIFGGSGHVRLIPGEQYAISGPMPPKTDRIEDFVIEGAAADGSVRIVPEGVFTGYMFGGGMWRGHILVDSHPRPGEYVVKVRDKFGEKQNPALVFTLRVFADSRDRRAHSPSVVMRWSGIEPYLLAACFGLTGLFMAGINFLLGVKWHAMLADLECGEIFRLKKVNGYYEAGVDMRHCSPVVVGATYRFSHPRRGNIGQGLVVACDKGEITIQVAPDIPIRLG
ncbi:MAG: hypothetical protein Q8K46_04755, partial [Deltaproteobacteria bacterium]|nr:hypothetical protein [Deltaproteobacteria bacterium]